MIRRAAETDVDFIYNTFNETLTSWTRQGVSESVKNDLAFVLDGAGVIIARLAADECEILNFAVCRDKRGQGYGKALLAFLLLKAKETDAHTVYLDVRETNNTAIHIYKKAGFEIYGERKNFYKNPQEDAILMRAPV